MVNRNYQPEQQEDQAPSSEVATITDKALLRQFGEMVVMIPSEDGNGAENILRQILAATKWEDLARPWETSTVDDILGMRLRVTKLTRRPSAFAGGLGMFLVVHLIDPRTQKEYVKVTGSINVVGQLVAGYCMGAMPMTIEWCRATKPTEDGFYPQHLKVHDGVTAIQGHAE